MLLQIGFGLSRVQDYFHQTTIVLFRARQRCRSDAAEQCKGTKARSDSAVILEPLVSNQLRFALFSTSCEYVAVVTDLNHELVVGTSAIEAHVRCMSIVFELYN